MSKLKEYKEEKEHKERKSKLKTLITKHFRISPRKIEFDDNKFFFWKDLIQKYSQNNDLCIFLEDKDLLPDELRNELIKCVELEMKKETKETKIENPFTLENIKQMFKDELEEYNSKMAFSGNENKDLLDEKKWDEAFNILIINRISEILSNLNKSETTDY